MNHLVTISLLMTYCVIKLALDNQSVTLEAAMQLSITWVYQTIPQNGSPKYTSSI